MTPFRVINSKAILERKPQFEQTHRQRHSRFILATNVLDAQTYPAQRLLHEYKQQQPVERGFLKDPLFFTSSVFVKKPQRVEALALVMALTLLVYTLGQRKLRQLLLAERPQLHGSGKYEIIDGMQRLNAVCGFIENLFQVNNRYFDVDEFPYAKQLADEGIFSKQTGENVAFLSRKECSDILDYQLAVTIYTAMEENNITEVFGRINSGGKHLSNQEKRQAGVTTPFAEVVRTIATKLRGDDSPKTLHLFDMPQVSIDSRQSHQGYGIQAEETLWCRQGILRISQLRDSEDEDMIADISASILLHEPLPRSQERLQPA